VSQVQNLEGSTQILTDLLQANVFTVSEPTMTRSEQYKVLFTYAVSVDKEKLNTFLSTYQPQNLSEQARANLVVIGTLLNVMDNTSFFITVDAKGMPYALKIDSVLDVSSFGIPTVLRIESQFDIHGHNKKQKIDSPSGAISFSEIENALAAPGASTTQFATTTATTSSSTSAAMMGKTNGATTTKSMASSTPQIKNGNKTAAPASTTSAPKPTTSSQPAQTTIIKKGSTNSTP
jgi:hypothetical protein